MIKGYVISKNGQFAQNATVSHFHPNKATAHVFTDLEIAETLRCQLMDDGWENVKVEPISTPPPSYTSAQLENVATFIRLMRSDGQLAALAEVSVIPTFKLGKLADGGYVPTAREVALLEAIQERTAAGLIKELPLFTPRESTRK